MPGSVCRREVGADADRVWRLIGGFDSPPVWHPGVEDCELTGDGLGAIRTMRLTGGNVMVERLDRLDEPARTVTYSRVSSTLVMPDYEATLKVIEGPEGGSVIEWTTFLPGNDESPVPGAELLVGFLEIGLDHLVEYFTPPRECSKSRPSS